MLGHPRESIALLRPALGGPMEVGNLHLTRTQLHAMLGHAFEAAGERDSAMTHYRWAVTAWRNADASLRARRDSAAARVAALERR